METKTIKQEDGSEIIIQPSVPKGDYISIMDGYGDEDAAIDIQKESLPSFHKAIGEFLPQEETTMETNYKKIAESLQGLSATDIEIKLKEFLPQVEVSDAELHRAMFLFYEELDRVKTDAEITLAYGNHGDNLRSLLSHSKQEKWISVEERLPDESIDVLVCISGMPSKYLHRCYYSNGKDIGAWMPTDRPIVEKYVTHWQTIPLPPTKGAKDK